jgi:hypothetical protein
MMQSISATFNPGIDRQNDSSVTTTFRLEVGLIISFLTACYTQPYQYQTANIQQFEDTYTAVFERSTLGGL